MAAIAVRLSSDARNDPTQPHARRRPGIALDGGRTSVRCLRRRKLLHIKSFIILTAILGRLLTVRSWIGGSRSRTPVNPCLHPGLCSGSRNRTYRLEAKLGCLLTTIV